MVLEDSGSYKPSAPGRDGHTPNSSGHAPLTPTSSLGLSTLGSGLNRAKGVAVGVAARMKRIAISAEPTGNALKKGSQNIRPQDLVIEKVDKSDR